MIGKIQDIILASINVKTRLVGDVDICCKIYQAVEACNIALNSGGSIYFCGNGGSAADAQHLSAELSGKFYSDRRPLPAEALHTNTSYLTAVANDYGYEFVYSRLLGAIGKSGDILFGLSTSGKSKNVSNAFGQAKKMGIFTIGLTGENGFADHNCDIEIKVPSTDTPRIQEAHLLIGHIICQLIEENLITMEKLNDGLFQ